MIADMKKVLTVRSQANTFTAGCERSCSELNAGFMLMHICTASFSQFGIFDLRFLYASFRYSALPYASTMSL